MKKKIISIMICSFFIFGLTGCAMKEQQNEEEKPSTTENSSIEEQEKTSSTEEEENPYVIALTSQEFFTKADLKESFYVAIVQDGCGACNAFKPIFHRYVLQEKITVYEINLTTDHREDVTKLIDEWGITHTPTTLQIQNGKEKNRLVGYQSEDSIKSFMNKS